MKKSVLMSSLVLGLMVAGGSHAASHGETEHMLFEDLDSDHNGAISMKEAQVRKDLSADFKAIDSNGNGSISVDEYTAYENKGRLVPEEVEVPEPGAAPMPAH